MAENTDRTVHVERRGPVCQLKLNRPPLNIMDLAMIRELGAALIECEGDPNVRVIVLRGAGEKGFSAGVSVQDHTPDRIAEMIPAFNDLFRLLARSNKVIVAAVQGFCLGGGFELILACDMVIASENAQFAQPEIKLGQLAPIGVILLPHLVGSRKAAELLLTGKSIGARDALALGLVNQVTRPEQLWLALEDLLEELKTQSGAMLHLTKQALRRTSALDLEKAIQETEDLFFESVVKTHDAKEGIFAFLEKRPPQWTHA
jgi:cyclohexa-1,5-dienecarbonyl-CoA hydratase